jgi:hypothetical protein
VKHGFKSWAEREAIHLRRQESLAPWDPLPSEFLAKRLNSVIIGPREVTGLSNAQLDVLLDGCASEWSAVTVQTELGGHVIIENTSHSPKRRETTRFHEMAHIIRGHRPTGFVSIPGVGMLLCSFNSEQEEEADWLGRCLQLPKPVLGWCLNRQLCVTEISELFQASEELVRYRLNKTGLLILRKRMARVSF